MSDLQERPLVTFALFSYNQEQYIREAVEGAFSQTYSPLEIILSDDGSTDRTFNILSEMAASYKGPHKLIINRMAKNSGIANHINYVIDLANGELVILAAGDDISISTRATVLTEAWLKNEKSSTIGC